MEADGGRSGESVFGRMGGGVSVRNNSLPFYEGPGNVDLTNGLVGGIARGDECEDVGARDNTPRLQGWKLMRPVHSNKRTEDNIRLYMQ